MIVLIITGLTRSLSASDLIVSAVYDGPLSGGTPKGVEIYVINAIPDLSIYGLGSANNGDGTDGEEFSFPADSVTAGSYIYIASESTGFTNFFGFAPDYTSAAVSINGNDAIELFKNGAVVDLFGDIDVDGTGQPWEYTDGWAYRKSSATTPTTSFDANDWTFSGKDALDGETSNASASTPVPDKTYAPSSSRDTTPPSISSKTPADDATGIAIDTNLTILFDENVSKGSGNIVIHKLSNDSVVETIAVGSTTLGSDNRTVTINPTAHLISGTAYYIKIPDGTFKDTSDNNFTGTNDNTTWNFTTHGASILHSIVFNEVLADPNSASNNFDTDGDGIAETADEFVEIYNTSSRTLDVGGLQFWDAGSDNYFTVPNATTLDANSFMVVVANIAGGALPSVSAGNHAYSANGSLSLGNTGDNLVLYDPAFDTYIQAIYNTNTIDTPVGNTTHYTGFSATATRIGSVFDFGSDTDGVSLALSEDGNMSNPVKHNTIGRGTTLATPGSSNVEATLKPPVEKFIHEIQGGGANSPLDGEVVTIEGIVVGDFQDGAKGTQGDYDGFFVQEEDNESDGNASTSEGIFVYDGTSPTVNVAVGDRVRITGTVDEYYGLTELTNIRSLTVISTGNTLPHATTLSLPVANAIDSTNGYGSPIKIADLEQYEGMLVKFSDTLTVSELYNLDRYGEFRLAQGSRPVQFTQNNVPNAAGYAAHIVDVAKRTIMVDDGIYDQNPDTVVFPDGNLSTTDDFRMGDTVANITGVLYFGRGSGSYGDATYRLFPTQTPNFVKVNNRSATPANVGGDLKIASLNVLNYFNTLDDSGAICGPNDDMDCRGADNAQELTRQTQKLIKVLQTLDADVVGFMEIENNYHKATPAIAYLVDELNTQLGSSVYDYVDPSGSVGDDAIATGVIYKKAKVTLPVDTTVEMLTDSDLRGIGMSGNIFNESGTNRVPLAATFEEIATGERFTFVVAHMKSKGSVGNYAQDADAEDGAGNSNHTRLLGVTALKKWLDTDPTGSSDSDFLIVGDMNAYAKEDPIVYLEDNNYTNLAQHFIGNSAYSYVYDGQIGTLDYAFANTSLKSQVTGATQWHINADEADAIDYNTDYGRATHMFDETVPYRQSDHDPVVIGLSLSDNRPPTSKDANITIAQDGSHTFSTANFYFDDNDSSDTLQKVVIASLPSKGNLKFNGSGVSINQEINASDITQLVYRPLSGESGDSYTSVGFKVSDGEDNSTSAYTITMHVSATPPPPANKAPVAGFSFVASNLSVDFSDSSIDSDGSVVSWAWSFRDGNSSTDQNPNHTYGGAGIYSVELTVSDDDGDSNNIIKSVTVTALTVSTDNNTTQESNSSSGNTTTPNEPTTPENNTSSGDSGSTENNNSNESETTTGDEPSNSGGTTENNNTTPSNENNDSTTDKSVDESKPTVGNNNSETPNDENTTSNGTDEEPKDESKAGSNFIQVIKTIARFDDALDVEIVETTKLTKATVILEKQSIEVRLNKVTQVAEVTITDSLTGKSKSLVIKLKDSQTDIDREGNIVVTTPIDDSSAIQTTISVDGKVEHVITYNNKTTKAEAQGDEANTTVDENGTVETHIQNEEGEFIYKAVVVTDKEGNSKTKFVKIHKVTGEQIDLSHTLRSDMNFEHGSTMKIFKRNGKIFIKTRTKLTTDLVIE
jgi:predicted extracellular nuclease/PKD repeat protein